MQFKSGFIIIQASLKVWCKTTIIAQFIQYCLAVYNNNSQCLTH